MLAGYMYTGSGGFSGLELEGMTSCSSYIIRIHNLINIKRFGDLHF